jgi:hypothetical protein
MRRLAIPAALFLVLSLMTGLRVPARAQEATPIGGGLTGYPKLSVTVTNDAVTVSPETVSSGYVIFGPPPGMTMDELVAMASTPTPDEGFPAFLYQAVIAGGVTSIPAGATAEAILKLEAGDWGVLTEGDQPPSFFKAVEGPDSVTTEPAYTASVDLGDFYIGGLDNGLAAGPQLIEVSNSGKQPHMLVMAKGPDTMTTDQLMALIQNESMGTPAPAGLSDEDLADQIGVLLLSSAQTMYLSIDLAPGTYGAACFITDPATHKEHAAEGMATTFAVK